MITGILFELRSNNGTYWVSDLERAYHLAQRHNGTSITPLYLSRVARIATGESIILQVITKLAKGQESTAAASMPADVASAMGMIGKSI